MRQAKDGLPSTLMTWPLSHNDATCSGSLTRSLNALQRSDFQLLPLRDGSHRVDAHEAGRHGIGRVSQDMV